MFKHFIAIISVAKIVTPNSKLTLDLRRPVGRTPAPSRFTAALADWPRTLLAWGFALLGATQAAARATETFAFQAPPNANRACSFDATVWPADLQVFATGAYEGRKLSFQIDQSGHSATQIDVAVNQPGKNVALILAAYEPTIWNIGWAAGTNIVGVLVGGYHRQAVAGLDASVPIQISTHDNKGPCGYFRADEGNLAPLNPLSRRVFGQAVTMFFPAKAGKALIGNTPQAGQAWETSTHTRPESFKDPLAPLAGAAGIEQGLRMGSLRRATQADAQAWLRHVNRATESPDLPPVAGGKRPAQAAIDIGDAYVVLKPYTYPSGLYGAHSVKFFVPKGVPKPKGDPGHSEVRDFNL